MRSSEPLLVATLPPAVAELGGVRRMSTHRVIHGLAILSLLVVASMSIVGSFRRFPATPTAVAVLTSAFAIAIWSWLILRIWRRPRQWGLGVGILLFLMIAFQSYLWWRGTHNPKLDTIQTGRSVTSFVFVYELPIFIAGVCCILLRFRYPNELKPSTT